ncbi:major facilitator superfamily domain-containing protein [Hypomontagnella submonticulosa]|nr:major facilitator superfamily domain-containing protein [Hypomontagnella submonticulosa]
MSTDKIEKNVFGSSDESERAVNTGTEEVQPHVHFTTYIAVFAVCLGFVAQNFAITGAGAQAQIIGQILHGTDTTWFTGSFVIFTVVLGPIVSQGADYWGRKPFLVVLSAFGGVGSIIVARAENLPNAIAGFCVIGISFGAQGLIHAVASEVLPRRWRSWGTAAALVSSELGLVLGLVVAGVLNRYGDPNGFRNFYYITTGLYFLSTILCIIGYNPPPTKQQLEVTKFSDKIKLLDWPGYLLLGFSLVLFCVSLSWSQNPYPWSDPHVAAPFAISIALAIALVVYQTWKPDGLFHHGLFQNRNFAVCLICIFGEGVAFFAANTYVAYEVSVLYTTDFLYAPLRLAIGFATGMIASAGVGLYSTLTKKLRWATFCAFVTFVGFFAGMAAAVKNDDTGVSTWGLPVLLGTGCGITLVTLVVAAQLCVPHSLITIASCLMLSVRGLGGTIGFALFQAVFQSQVSLLGDNIAQAVAGAGLPSGSVAEFVTDFTAQNSTGLLAVPGVTPEIIAAGTEAFRETYKLGFYNVWVTAVAFISFAAVCSIFIFDPSSEFNNHIDAPVEKVEELYSEG